MDTGWIVWGLFLFGAFVIGLCAIIFSTRIVKWVFSWSVPFVKTVGNVPNLEGQHQIAVWIIRVWGGLACGGSLAMLVSALITNL